MLHFVLIFVKTDVSYESERLAQSVLSSEVMEDMSKVFEAMKPYSWMMVCIVVLLAAEVMFALILPGYMADIVNDGVIPGHLSVIWRNGLIMLGITLLSMVAALIVGYFTARTATGISNDLREAVYDKVLSFSNAEVNKFNTSSLITRTTNDIMQVQNTLMMAIRQFIYAPIIAVGGIIRALDRSVDMAWIVALATIIMLVLMGALFFIALPKFTSLQKLIDRLNTVTRENLSGILVVRAFSTQKFEKKRFAEANKELAGTERFVNQTFAFMTPIISLIMNITTAAIVWVGAQQASAFRADIGDIFAFLQYGMLIIFSFLMISMMFIMVPRAVVSANRIKEVLETEGSIVFKDDPVPFPQNFKGTVEFKDVSFRVSATKVKFCRASLYNFSPFFFATSAHPPIANMVPIPNTRVMYGITIFTALNASTLMPRDAKTASTMLKVY